MATSRAAEMQSAVLRLTAVTVGAAGALWLLHWSRRKPLCWEARSLAEERAKLLPLLKELARRFFNACTDVSSVSKAVRAKIEANQVNISDSALRAQLARQCHVHEKLQEVQAEVAARFACTADEINEMQRRHAADEQVQAYVVGLSAMIGDALGGLLPILPNAEVPEALTEERVLEILAEVQALETQKVLEKVGGSRLSVKDLGDVLTVAHRDAWEDRLETHREEIGECKELYHSTLGLYMRREAFAAKRKLLDDAHQDRMVQLFKTEKSKGKRSSPKNRIPHADQEGNQISAPVEEASA